uniref:PH domain-containing protein n=1 Tax=Heterorhabditis bacteriophora TaxID=37862 RepID=A0A1I7X3K2_HETBA
MRSEYETRIENLQRQVDLAQSMISSCGSNWEGDRILTDSLLQFTEECKWTSDQERIVRKAAIKWRFHQFTSVRDDLWGNAIFVKEANAISVELKKKVQFQFVLLTDTMYRLETNTLLSHRSHKPGYRTRLGTVASSSRVRMTQRLESMRDMYEADSQLSPVSPEDPMMEALMGTDPFYDRFPWFRMIGRVKMRHKRKEFVKLQNYIFGKKISLEPTKMEKTKFLAFLSLEDETSQLQFPAHMKENEEFCFRVVVLQAIDVSEQYSDVFCQFNRRLSTKLSFQQPSLVISTPVKSKKANAPIPNKYAIFNLKNNNFTQFGEIKWKDCQELVVGRIRSGPEWNGAEDIGDLYYNFNKGNKTSFAFKCRRNHYCRMFFQFEAAWDSSLHNSPLLNRVSNYGDQKYHIIYIYIYIYMCVNLNLKFGTCQYYPRKKIYLKNSAVRRQRRVLDTSSAYVRGEENLGQWRPRGDSLIFEHQWELEKLTRLQQVERVRLFLRLRDKLKGKRKLGEARTPVSPCNPKRAIPEIVKLDDKEKVLMLHSNTLTPKCAQFYFTIMLYCFKSEVKSFFLKL